ncbi:MAG: AmmeMemoRadiSam system protein B [Treponemataceae bacterium]|nr:AmmeMemoRadiSam system protein B [Treponemataceae bacterium]
MAKDSVVKIRDMVLADLWYPQDGTTARSQIQNYEQEQSSLLIDTELHHIHGYAHHIPPLARTESPQNRDPSPKGLPFGTVRLMLLPHAAWNLTGPLLSRAFLCARFTTYQQIILIGPSHDTPEEGIFISESDLFTTPLGPVRVDPAGRELFSSASTLVSTNDILHLSEYSLEPLLPFIAYYFPETPIVPVLTGRIPQQKSIMALRRALELAMLGENGEVLIIISCNFSSSPHATLPDLFAPLFIALEHHNEETLLQTVHTSSLTICGLPALLACLRVSFFSSLTMNILGSLSVDGEEGRSTHHYHAIVWHS